MMHPAYTRPRPLEGEHPPHGAEIWRELPGHVEDSPHGPVTLESHTFWVAPFYEETRGARLQVRGATLYCRNGAGLSSLEVNRHLAEPIVRLIDAGAPEAAFHLAWGAFQIARDARHHGAEEERARIFQAHADGRLKKRKARGRPEVRVWVERAPLTA